jgi:hypothetical protein
MSKTDLYRIQHDTVNIIVLSSNNFTHPIIIQVAMPRQNIDCCSSVGVGYHFCGVGSHWILLHVGATYDLGGDRHPW